MASWRYDGPRKLAGDYGLSEARGVSGDGSIIVGVSEWQAFIWDETNGMRNLQDVLVDDFGLDMQGFSLTWAHSISDDGKTIVGGGLHAGYYEAFVATIPEPAGVCIWLALMALMGRRRP